MGTAPVTTPGDWVGRRADDPAPIIYYSGVANCDEQVLYDRVPYRFRCMSFAFLGAPKGAKTQVPVLDFCLKNNIRIFLDSGAHSFQNIFYGKNRRGSNNSKLTGQATVAQQLDNYMAEYVAFVKKLQPTRIMDFFVTFDYQHNCQVIREMTRRLLDMGIRPVPVYHGDASIDWFRRYIDEGHKLIGISWSEATAGGKHRARYYDHVFDIATKAGVSLHGFAQTGPAMFAWPWYSVDSATWLKAAAFGKIIDAFHPVSGHPKIRQVAVSDQAVVWDKTTKSQFKELQAKVKARGFDFNALRTDRIARITYNLLSFEEISKKCQYKEQRWGRLL